MTNPIRPVPGGSRGTGDQPIEHSEKIDRSFDDRPLSSTRQSLSHSADSGHCYICGISISRYEPEQMLCKQCAAYIDLSKSLSLACLKLGWPACEALVS